ncbi:MAG: GNAT family N-acetyltransferase [Armatimonadota bacterium]|nr:MAG: GNAT family N-acetyltransferase [Armatimonadota bacterium]
MTSAAREGAIKVRQRGNWTRVYAEEDGRDVSHLSYGTRVLRMGPKGAVRMGGIGGVGTEREFRRRGLARQVLARAMEEMGREAYSCVGLYTSTRIVAHRLYRRFGFVGVMRSARAYKVLDPERLVLDALNEALKGSSGFSKSRSLVEITLRPHEPVVVRLDAEGAHPLPRGVGRSDLSISMSTETFFALWEGGIDLRYAEDANLLEWQGDEGTYRQLSKALDERRRSARPE